MMNKLAGIGWIRIRCILSGQIKIQTGSSPNHGGRGGGYQSVNFGKTWGWEGFEMDRHKEKYFLKGNRVQEQEREKEKHGHVREGEGRDNIII